MKRLGMTIVLIMGLVIALNAFEHGKDCHDQYGMKQEMRMKMHDGENHEMLFKKLELNEGQQDKISQLQSAHKKEMIDLKADIEIKKVDQHDARKNHDFNELKKITSEIYDLKKSIALKRIDHREKIWNILTPEQQEKADEMRKEGYHNKKMQFRQLRKEK